MTTSLLSQKQKLTYSSARFGTTLLLGLTDFATFWIYSDHFGLSGFQTGIGTGVGKVIIAFSSFFAGLISDILPSSIIGGRRKLFLRIGAPCLAFSFFMLFIPHLFFQLSNSNSVWIWLLTWNSLFQFFYGFLITPYQSWMPELTNENERVQISSYQNLANISATALSTGAAFFIADKLKSEGGIQSTAGMILLYTIIVFAIIEVLLYTFVIIFVPEEHSIDKTASIKNELRDVVTNKNYVIWLIAQSFIVITVSFLITLLIDYVQDILKVKNIIIFGFILFLISGVGIVIWSFITDKFGKKRTLIAGLIWIVVSLPLTLLLTEVSNLSGFTLSIIFGGLIGIGFSSYYLFPYIIIADISDLDYELTGVNKAGMYTGINFIPLNLAQALAQLLAGAVKDGGLLNWMGPIGAVFVLLAIPIVNLGNFDNSLDMN